MGMVGNVGIDHEMLAPSVIVYPDATDSVPDPDIVDTLHVEFAPTVNVYPDATDSVPDPETVGIVHVVLALTVNV
jgi:hypothetical protein